MMDEAVSLKKWSFSAAYPWRIVQSEGEEIGLG